MVMYIIIDEYNGIMDKDLRNKLIAKQKRLNHSDHIRSGKYFDDSDKIIRGNKKGGNAK